MSLETKPPTPVEDILKVSLLTCACLTPVLIAALVHPWAAGLVAGIEADIFVFYRKHTKFT